MERSGSPRTREANMGGWGYTAASAALTRPEEPSFSVAAPLLNPSSDQVAIIPPGPPILVISIDTEAEFDWRGPFLRTQTSVLNLRAQAAAQQIFDRFRVRPVYLVDYAVATQPEGYLPLLDIVRGGRCEIGAHLHPWITPPFVEVLGERTSFSQNLSPTLQEQKLARLTDAITTGFGVRPTCYRAGRYGVGDEIAHILLQLGYQTDMSALPGIDMRRLHGPDFRKTLDKPYWFGSGLRLLEIPGTPGFAGLFAHPRLPAWVATEVYARLSIPALNRLRLRGIFARLGLLERIPLSPEGVAIAGLRQLTRALLARGNRVFVLAYHSSSLLPGATQYVGSLGDLSLFLQTIEQYVRFFIDQLGGISMTPSELHATLAQRIAPAPLRSPVPIAKGT